MCFYSETALLRSYTNWPHGMNLPESLSAAGLFIQARWKNFWYHYHCSKITHFYKLLCLTGRSDVTKCLHCGGEIQGWRGRDNSWTEHVLWYPILCTFDISRAKDSFANIEACKHKDSYCCNLYHCKTYIINNSVVSTVSLCNNEDLRQWLQMYFNFLLSLFRVLGSTR